MKNLFRIEIDRNRVFGLDVIRAAAILFVVLGHGGHLMPRGLYVDYVYPLVLDGVSIFFVLSGYLIGGILIRNLQTKPLNSNLIAQFWIRRWFRTLPNYFLVLSCLTIVYICFIDGFNYLEHWQYFFFAQNLFYPHPKFFPEAWSLSVEEWFYLVLPVFLAVFIKVFRFSVARSVVAAAVMVILTSLFFRQFNTVIYPELSFDLSVRKQVITRLDSLMFGVIGAHLAFYHSNIWDKMKRPGLVLGLLLILLEKYQPFQFQTTLEYQVHFSFPVMSVSILLILPYFSSWRRIKNSTIARTVTTISLISYSMYLIHYSCVLKFLLHVVNWEWLQNIDWNLFRLCRYFIYWFATILISILLYKFYEVPSTKIRDRFHTR